MNLLFEFPLLRRELIGHLRTRRAIWLLLAGVAGAAAVPLMNWPTFHGNAHADSVRNAELFLFCAVAQLTAALVIVPAFSALAFTSERENNTFDLVYSTLLRPSSIVFSKFLSSIGYTVILIVACAPVICLLYLLGGLDTQVVIITYATTFIAVTVSTLVCLTVSLRAKTTAGAVIRSIAWLLFWNGGLSLVLALMASIGRAADGTLIMSLTPYGPIVIAGYQGPFQPFGSLRTAFVIYSIASTIVAVPHLGYLLRRTRRPYDAETSDAPMTVTQGLIEQPRKLARTWLTRVLMRLGKSLPGFENPIFQKELRSEFFSRVQYRVIAFGSIFMLYLLIALVAADGGVSCLYPLFNLNLFFTLLFVTAVASTSFTREIEQGNIDFLRSSLITMPRIVIGKFYSSLYSGACLVGPLVVILPFALLDDEAPRAAVPAAIVITAVTYVLCGATGVLISVVCRRSVNALVLAFGVLAAWNIVLPLLVDSTVGLPPSSPAQLVAAFPFLALNQALDPWATDATRSATIAGCYSGFFGAATVVGLVAACIAARIRHARER